MYLLPYSKMKVHTGLTPAEIKQRLEGERDKEEENFYWFKNFKKPFFGKVKEDGFKMRKVVPYWNISPLQLNGQFKSANGKTEVEIEMTSPYVFPTIIVVVVLMVLLYFTKDEWMIETYLHQLLIGIPVVAYLMVNLPFQREAWFARQRMEELLK